MIALNDLRIYQKANNISNQIWKMVLTWNDFEKNTIGKQLVRSADSIGANIAEGYGRFFYKDRRLFCYYSRGSLVETIHWLEKCKGRKMGNDSKLNMLIDELKELHVKLNKYIKTLSNNVQ